MALDTYQHATFFSGRFRFFLCTYSWLCLYRMAPKSKLLQNDQKIVL